MTSQYPSGYGVPPEVVQMILIKLPVSRHLFHVVGAANKQFAAILNDRTFAKEHLLSDRFTQNPPETDIHYWTRLVSDVPRAGPACAIRERHQKRNEELVRRQLSVSWVNSLNYNYLAALWCIGFPINGGGYGQGFQKWLKRLIKIKLQPRLVLVEKCDKRSFLVLWLKRFPSCTEAVVRYITNVDSAVVAGMMDQSCGDLAHYFETTSDEGSDSDNESNGVFCGNFGP
ncbi:hypothetical protein BDR26DRAFT_935845 [Obelidium mucronatum]|nr:hypothetical protein BDR26DRAFT_935845 [Obelidium mucronatum]